MASSHLEYANSHRTDIQATFVIEEILNEIQTFQTKIIQLHIKEINVYI